MLASPTVGLRLLMPGLAAFAARRDGCEVALTTILDSERLEPASWDVAVLYGDGRWPGTVARPLFPERLGVLAAPGMMPEGDMAAAIADVALLHSSTDRRDWPLWARAAGLDPASVTRGTVFETLEMTLKAAIAGHGATVADVRLAREHLEAARLVMPFPFVVASGRGYHLVTPVRGATHPVTEAFVAWLRDRID